MVKLTADLICTAFQRINPVKDRELDLRGYKIPLLENLGATLNQFDTIDFSDNDIRKLDNFPLLPRLKNLIFNGNRIMRFADKIDESLPNLTSLVLTNNSVQELADLDPLTTFVHLENLSLLFNPVSTKPHYREYLIYKMPNLRVLDFRRIKQKEREDAKAFFKSKKGKDIRKEIAQKVSIADYEDSLRKYQTEEEINEIKRAIQNASTLEEIERLNQILRSGHIPKNFQEALMMEVDSSET